jgi:hypothetical protein
MPLKLSQNNMKIRFRLIDILRILLGETKNIPAEYRERAEAIERSLRRGRWKITGMTVV